jgi:threonine aldolase
VLSIQAMTRPFNAVVCADTAHIHVHETGAPEKHAGVKLVALPTPAGKLTPDDVAPTLDVVGFEHAAQPKVVSVSQATELGTVYTPSEVRALADFAHDNGLLLHMDGARLANAAASLGTGLREITRDAGVDVLSFGATKNGTLAAEAVVFFDESLAEGFDYARMQGTQLASKMRFLSAQFDALLQGDLWREMAAHANAMAKRMEAGLRESGVEVVFPVESNAVFPRFPKERIGPLQQEFYFYTWDEEEGIVRLMASFDTTEEDVDAFVSLVAEG